MSLWSDWQADRSLRARADAYARLASADAAPDTVRWLAVLATRGDEDHAQWELRYLRRAIALLVAERDALDDRTGSAVARALTEMLHRDRSVAADRVHVAERQFNLRLGRYREVLRARGPGTAAERVGTTLLQMAGGASAPALGADDAATAIAAAVLDETQERLRTTFGVAQLPENVRPSDAAS